MLAQFVGAGNSMLPTYRLPMNNCCHHL
uniref:Uncharacterized protein n=1 Tax=Arundo donax TaxID=35708 RepID=A0A0A9C798_ARUDO